MTATSQEQPASTSPPIPAAPARGGGRFGRRRTTGTAAPAARFEPGRVAEPSHRNPTWIGAGVLLVLLRALGGVLLFTSTDDRSEVLVAARDLDPGRPVERADLRIQRVALDSDVSSLPVTAADGLIGQHPVGRIPAGTMLAA